VWLGPFVAILLCITMLRAWRWRSTFVPTPTISIWRFVHIINVGYLANNILPLRAGEFARAYLAGRHESASIPQALSTILLERVLDTLMNVLLLCVALVNLPTVPDFVRQAGIVTGGLSVLGALLLIVAASRREQLLSFARYALKRIGGRYADQAMGFLVKLFDGLEALNQPALAFRIVVLALTVWVLYIVLAICMFQAFEMDLPITAAILVICVTNLGTAIPSTPGFMGVYHSLAVLTLMVFMDDRNLALSFSLVLHGVQYLFFNLLGAISLVRLSLSITHLRAMSITVADEQSL
jgi:uncharacterized protein (TIRG00374 family)